MISEAYILSNLGVAYYKLRKRWFVIDSRSVEESRYCHLFDLNTILHSNSEILFLEKIKNIKELKSILIRETKCQDALTYALELMDASIKRKNTKELIAKQLNFLIEEDLNIYDFLEARLFSLPLDPIFNPNSAYRLVKDLSFERLTALFNELDHLSDAISIFNVCWNKVTIKNKRFKRFDEVEKNYILLSDKKHIKNLIISIAHQDRDKWDNTSLNAALTLGWSDTDFFQKELLEELNRTYNIGLFRKTPVLATGKFIPQGELLEINKYSESFINSLTKELSFDQKIRFEVKNRLVEYLLNEYNKVFLVKSLIHRIEPVKLLDIYYPLQLRTKPDLSRYKFDDSEGIDIKSVSDLFQDNQYITIIGDAGSGKSTLIKYLFLSCLKENYKIPITIELRNLDNQERNLEQYITQRIFDVTQISTSKKISEQLLSMGKFLFFLDGYDEINSEKKESLTQEINEFVRKYNRNSYLMTSRPYTGILLLPLFKSFWISKLSMKDVEGFIEKQMINEHVRLLKTSIVHSIHSFEDEGVYDFLSNPLLLSIFILTYEYNPQIPQKKSLYYQQVFDALFSSHDSLSKYGYIRNRKSKLDKEGIEDVLQQFSVLTYFREAHIYQVKYLSDLFSKIKSLNPKFNFVNSDLIDDLTTNIGLIVRDGWNHYYFAHRSLQEYFAAQCINKLDGENKLKIYQKILQKIDDPNSKEIMNFISILQELNEIYFLENMTIPYLHNIKRRLENASHPFDFFIHFAEFKPELLEIVLKVKLESTINTYLTHIRDVLHKIKTANRLLSKSTETFPFPLSQEKLKELTEVANKELKELKSQSKVIKKKFIVQIDKTTTMYTQDIENTNLKNSEIIEILQ